MSPLVYLPIVLLCAWATPQDQCTPKSAIVVAAGKKALDTERACNIVANFAGALASDERSWRLGYLKGGCIATTTK